MFHYIYSMTKKATTIRVIVPKERTIFIKMMNLKKNMNFMTNIMRVVKMKNTEVSTNKMTITR